MEDPPSLAGAFQVTVRAGPLELTEVNDGVPGALGRSSVFALTLLLQSP